jgi:hypothetical protein
MNEIIAAGRGNKFGAGKQKKDVTAQIAASVIADRVPKFSSVWVDFLYVVRNSRRDLDNLGGAKKFIMDALVDAEVIPSDRLKHVKGFRDMCEVSKSGDYVVITLYGEPPYWAKPEVESEQQKSSPENE